MKNKIEFAKDGSSFSFIFADGSESLEFGSKEAGFKAVADLANKQKITVGEFGKFRDEILQAENLPWSEKQTIDVNIGIPFGFGLLGGLLSQLAEISALSSLVDLAHAPDKPVEVAYFKMCDCGGNHGRIYCKGCYTTAITSKKDVPSILNELQAKEFITLEELEKVKGEVAISTLPE